MSSDRLSDDSKPKSRLSLREYLRNRNRPGASSSSSSATTTSTTSSSYSSHSQDHAHAPSSRVEPEREPHFRRVRSPPRPQGVRIPVYHPQDDFSPGAGSPFDRRRHDRHRGGGGGGADRERDGTGNGGDRRVFEARPGSYDVPVAYGSSVPPTTANATAAVSGSAPVPGPAPGPTRSSSRWDRPGTRGSGSGTGGAGYNPVSMIPGIATAPAGGSYPQRPLPYAPQQQQPQHVPLSQVAPIRAGVGAGAGAATGPRSHVHISAPVGPTHTLLGGNRPSVVGVGMKRDRGQGVGIPGVPGTGGGGGFYGHFSQDRRLNMPSHVQQQPSVSYGPAMKRRRMGGPGAAAVMPSRPGVAVAGSALAPSSGAGPPPKQGDGLFVSFGKKIFVPWSEVRNEGALPTRMIVCFKFYHAGSCYTKDCDMVHVTKEFLNQFRDKPAVAPQAAIRPRNGRGGGGGSKKSKSEKKILLWFPAATFQLCTQCGGRPHQIPTTETMLEGARTLEESMDTMRTGPQTGGDVRVPHASEVRTRLQSLSSVYGIHKKKNTYPSEVVVAMERAKGKLRRLSRNKGGRGGARGRRRR